MAGVSGGLLAARASLAGGFGFIAAGYDSVDKIQSEIATAKSLTGVSETGQIPIGLGYLVWQIEKNHPESLQLIDIALDNGVKALWFSFGKDVGTYVQYVRDRQLSSTGSSMPTIFVLVSSPEEALMATKEWAADVLVVQGREAGGHGLGSAPPLMSLLGAVLKAVPSASVVVAAGGLAHGSHVAEVLDAGASGAVLGTRFLLAPESFYTSVQRQVLIQSPSTASVRTMAFDHARGTMGWPEGIDGRGIRNDTVNDFEDDVDSETLQRKFSEGVKDQDPDRMLVWAGTGVGLMDRVQPAAEIMHELHTECWQSLCSRRAI